MALPYATTNQVEKKVKESTDELIKKLESGEIVIPGGGSSGLEEIPLASIENNRLDDSAIEHLRTLARNHSNVILIVNNEDTSFYPLLAKLQWFQESSWEEITFITSLGDITINIYQGSD